MGTAGTGEQQGRNFGIRIFLSGAVSYLLQGQGKSLTSRGFSCRFSPERNV